MSIYTDQKTALGIYDPEWMEPDNPERGSIRWIELGKPTQVQARPQTLEPIEVTLTVEGVAFWKEMEDVVPITPDPGIWIGIPTTNRTRSTE